MANDALFTPTSLGALDLKHRVVLAPLTRNRADLPGHVPNDLMVEYYRQRASAGGLLITEATQVVPEGRGYPGTPGIHSDEQVAGWRKVTSAVHDKGGRIVMQLWHVGRISHSAYQPDGRAPAAPSAIAAQGDVYLPAWTPEPFPTPRALDLGEIPGIVAAYRRAAENAKAAGFDGVEIHGANGYLLDQFLEDGTNKRTDIYGGPVENRARLLLEVADSAIAVFGADRVGVRLSPFGSFNDMSDSDPVATFGHAIRELAARKIAYLHLIQPRWASEDPNAKSPSTTELFRPYFPGPIIAAGGYDGADAATTVARGEADAVAFGRVFIANPDLPERLKRGAPLNPYDRSTFYGGTEKGYTDYPALEAVA